MKFWDECLSYAFSKTICSVIFFIGIGQGGYAQKCNVTPKLEFDIVSCSSVLITLKSSPPGQLDESKIYWGNINNDSVVGINQVQRDTFRWDYGDSSRINHTIKLVVKDKSSAGCFDTLDTTIMLPPKPKPAFITNKVCFGDTLKLRFSPNASGMEGVDSFYIDFGDGTTAASDKMDFNKVYGAIDSFDVKLVKVQKVGSKGIRCVDRDVPCPRVRVYANPSTDFIIPDTVCVDQLFAANDTSTLDSSVFKDSIQTFLWDFGNHLVSKTRSSSVKDGDTSHSYSSPGRFKVSLTVTSAVGQCSSDTFDTIHVCPKPKVQFNAKNTCENDTVRFINTTKNDSCCGTITSYKWDFGNGKSSSDYDAYQIYDKSRFYEVKLTAYNGGRLLPDSDSLSYTVIKSIWIGNKPGTTISVDNACDNEDVEFKFSVELASDSIKSVTWDYGDDSTAVKNYPETYTHRYDSLGIYKFRCITETQYGCRDTVKDSTVQIYPAPIASFHVAATCQNQEVVFQEKSQIHTSSSITSYKYSFQKNSSETFIKKENRIHRYDVFGTYTPSVTVISNKNCTSVYDTSLQIYQVPVVDFSISTDSLACKDKEVNFTNKSTGSRIKQWLWDFDGIEQFSSKDVIDTFKTIGTKSIKLIATSIDNCVDSMSKDIEVLQSPQPEFSISQSTGCTPLAVTLEVVSPSPFSKYSWLVDNTATQDSIKLIDTFFSNGSFSQSYTARLTATNKCGSKSNNKDITVSPRPQASLSIIEGNSQFCGEENFVFKSTSSGSPDSLFWTLEDGDVRFRLSNDSTTDTVRKFFEYSEPSPLVKDLYIRLRVKNGCDEDDSVITVTARSSNVTASLSFVGSNNLYGCVPHTVRFLDKSTNADTILYDFQEYQDTGGVGKIKEYTFVKSGNYKIKQYAIGCGKDTFEIEDSIEVYALPKAEILNLPDRYCSGQDLMLKAAGKNLSKVWYVSTSRDFNSFNSFTQDSPTVNLFTQGSANTWYYIRLKVREIQTTGPICENETWDSVLVVPHPVPVITPNSLSGCHPMDTSFFNNSTNANKWVWHLLKYDTALNSYNDTIAINSRFKKFDYTFQNTSTETERYLLHLTIDNGVCTDTTSTPILVYPLPKSGFTFELLDSKTRNCNSGSQMGVKFKSEAKAANEYLWNFGNGALSFDRDSATHTFKVDQTKQQDSFPVWLTVKSKLGCVDSFVDTVFILSQPKILLNTSLKKTCQGDTLPLKLDSVESDATYRWVFFRTDVSTFRDTVAIVVDSTPKVVFQHQKKPGSVESEIYSLKLYVSFPNGCKDSLTDSSFIQLFHRSIPKFGFHHLDTFPNNCYPDGRKRIQFYADSSINAKSYSWQFEGGAFGKRIKKQHTFDLPSGQPVHSYKTTLITENANACVDTFIDYAEVKASPVIDISQQPIPICEGDTLTFSPLTIESKATYSWFFDGIKIDTGDVITESFPAKNWTASLDNEKLELKFLAEFSTGCKDSIVLQDHVVNYYRPKPHFWFTHRDTLDDDCYPDGRKAMLFYPDSSTHSKSFTWKFETRTPSTDEYPGRTFILPNGNVYDSFWVQLITDNGQGCIDSMFRYVPVKTNPKVHISQAPINICEGDTLTFSPLTIEPKATYSWFFDGTKTDTGDVITEWFPAKNWTASLDNEKVELKLLAEFSAGCKDSIILKDHIVNHYRPKPHFWFTHRDTLDDDCYPDGRKAMLFYPDSSTHSKSFAWKFETRTPSTDEYPARTFRLPGGNVYDSFWVQLITDNRQGCIDSTYRYVPVKANPKVHISQSPIPICEGDTLTFSPLAIESKATYSWFFDGTKTDTGDVITEWFPAKNWTALLDNEKVELKLLAEFSTGCKDSVILKDHIVNYYRPKPHFWFTHRDTLNDDCYPDGRKAMLFYPDSSTHSKSFAWKFETRTPSIDEYPARTFRLPQGQAYDSFQVQLTTQNTLGCSDSLMRSIEVKARPNPIFYRRNGHYCEDDTACLSPGQYSSEARYTWRFGNVQSIPADSVCYSVPILSNQNNIGYETMDVKLVAIYPQTKCVDSFLANNRFKIFQLPESRFTQTIANPTVDDCYLNGTKTVQFDASGSYNAAEHYWDFGDGSTSLDSVPLHQFQLEAGVKDQAFTITHTATNANKCSHITQQKVRVLRRPNVAFDNTVPIRTCEDSTVCFQPSKAYANAQYHWKLDNGDPLYLQTDRNQQFCTSLRFYDTSGTVYNAAFDLELTMTLPNGCSDTFLAEDHVFIYQHPKVNFDTIRLHPAPDYCYKNGRVAIQFNSGPSTNTFLTYWTFGDGNESVQTNPIHTFQLEQGTIERTYTVTLKALNKLGCEAQGSQNVLVKALPKVDFDQNKFNVCEEELVCLEPSPETVNGFVTHYTWKFEDNQSGITQEHCRTFFTDDSIEYRDVTLVVALQNGCIDSLTRPNHIAIRKKPTAFFEFEDILTNPYYDVDTPYGKVRYFDRSIVLRKDTFPNNFWTLNTNLPQGSKFRDGEFSFFFKYEYNGQYTTQLIIEDENQCRDTFTAMVKPKFFGNLFVPNALAPEVGIGEAAIFLPKGVGLREYSLEIYDQNWRRVFITTALDTNGVPLEPWDGRFNDVFLPQGVYYWNIKGLFRNGRVWEGSLQGDRRKSSGKVLLLR